MTHPLKGRRQSPEHIARRVAAWKLSEGPEKARQQALLLSKNNLGRPASEERKAATSAALKGKKNSLGTIRSKEFRRKLSNYWKEHRTEHNMYIDGKSAERNGARLQDMGRLDYRLWREAVFRRDGWKCVLCGAIGYVQADHIKPYLTHPDLRYSVDNGRTLCRPCHMKADTHGAKVHKKRPNPVTMEIHVG